MRHLGILEPNDQCPPDLLILKNGSVVRLVNSLSYMSQAPTRLSVNKVTARLIEIVLIHNTVS
jgi:hypothetical protein